MNICYLKNSNKNIEQTSQQMKIKFTTTKALLLLYVAQFLMATDCTGCNCHSITKCNVVYTGVEIVPWDTSKFRNKIAEGTAIKNSLESKLSFFTIFRKLHIVKTLTTIDSQQVLDLPTHGRVVVSQNMNIQIPYPPSILM